MVRLRFRILLSPSLAPCASFLDLILMPSPYNSNKAQLRDLEAIRTDLLGSKRGASADEGSTSTARRSSPDIKGGSSGGEIRHQMSD